MAEPSTPPPDGSPASPAALDISRGDELEKYTLRGARQILQLLQDLITHRGLITAHTGDGHSFMTAVLKVDEERARVVLDPSPDPQANRRALAAPRLTCITQLDGIRIQFPLVGLSEGQDKGRSAFIAPLPTEMLRLQRREFYRLQVPLAHELSCLLRAEDLARKPVEVSARVIDIGAGNVLDLAQEQDGRELLLKYAYETLKYIARLWSHKVRLHLKVHGSYQTIVCNHQDIYVTNSPS